jgi:hypothetical protein
LYVYSKTLRIHATNTTVPDHATLRSGGVIEKIGSRSTHYQKITKLWQPLSISEHLHVVPVREEENMQYLLLIYEDEKRFNKGYPEAEMSEYQAFGKEFAGAIKGGNALKPTTTATTVRLRDGKRLTTDGPFAETKEQLGGYYMVEAGTQEEAVAIAAKIPGARFGSIEVRPIMTFS